MKDSKPPLALYPVAALLVFVFFHSLMPFDHRIRMGFKTFSPEMSLAPAEIWYSVKKWRHILWFAIFFPLVRSIFAKRTTEHATAKAMASLMLVTFLIEFEECFVAGKHGRLADVLPNLIGACVGAFVWRLWRRRRARSDRSRGT